MPRAWNPLELPEREQRSLITLTRARLCLPPKILPRPFLAPGPRIVHWLSQHFPRTLASRRSQSICQAKNPPTLGMDWMVRRGEERLG